MKTISIIMLMLFFSITISSCATIVNTGSQTILARATDNQEGVEVEVKTPSGAYPTTLPATIAAEPSTVEEVTIRVIDECYDSTQQTVPKNVTPSYWLNLLLLYPGLIIDYVTGKMWKYDSNVAVPVNKKEECKNES